MFLFPDHDVDIASSLNNETIEIYDLLMVDGSIDELRGAPGSELLRKIEKCPLPTLWLEGKGEGCPVERKNLIILPQPLNRESLRDTFGALLSPKESNPVPDPRTRAGNRKGNPSVSKKAKRKKPAPKVEQVPIELVEVVEEAPSETEGTLHDERNL